MWVLTQRRERARESLGECVSFQIVFAAKRKKEPTELKEVARNLSGLGGFS